MIQLILHLLGDYVTQNNWIAQNKTKNSWVCLLHVLLYSLPFLLLTDGFTPAWFVIAITHFFIDRFRLAKYWIKLVNCKLFDRLARVRFESDYFKQGNLLITSSEELVVVDMMGKDYLVTHETDYSNFIKTPWGYIGFPNTETGYSKNTPIWLSTWLLIIIDNIFHITINYLSLTYL